jgi:SOS-response transcriptional repressor LexA
MAFELARGPWKGKVSLRLVGPARSIEAEDFHGQKGFVPLLAPIAAGEPREAHDQGFPVGAADRYIEFDADDPNAFALTVDGASMEPEFRHGDIVVARPAIGRKRSGLADGAVAVVLYEGERLATLKIIRFGSLNRSTHEPMDYKLEPLNPLFPPLRLKTKEIAAIRPVVGLIRREG